ncbi:MAG: LysM peptidoglycan-binding domain-containing protein [candidate division KSB1 bacterium]|nr:LysM peptidoglycan-binding domain-containing protein [candidate division KSB1 bacterium]
MHFNWSVFFRAILLGLSLPWYCLVIYSCSYERSEKDIKQAVALGKQMQSKKDSQPHNSGDFFQSLSDDESYHVRKHILKPGETLRDVAVQYGTDWQTILEANALSDSARLQAGQTILIPIKTSNRSMPLR